MTTGQQAENPVDEGQREIDQVQEGALEQPSAVSRADLDTMKEAFETQLRSMQAEQRGLQSRLDKDRQEAERETRTRVAEAEVARMRANAQALDDPAQKALWENQADLEQRRIDEARQVAPVAQADPARDMERQMVRNMGVDPDNQAIDYGALSDSNISTVDGRQQKFFASFKHLVVQPAPVATAPAQPAPSSSNVVTPPSNAAPSTQGGGFATLDDLNAAVIQGTISNEQWLEQKRQRGW